MSESEKAGRRFTPSCPGDGVQPMQVAGQPIGVGDMIEYEGNGIKVMMYAREIYPDRGLIRDGNVCCSINQVTRVVHTAAELKEKREAAGRRQKGIADELHDFFRANTEALGGQSWHAELSVPSRADSLYWLVFLAEKGIEKMRADFKAQPGGAGASEAASLGSWSLDLKAFVRSIKDAVVPPAAGPKK